MSEFAIGVMCVGIVVVVVVGSLLLVKLDNANRRRCAVQLSAVAADFARTNGFSLTEERPDLVAKYWNLPVGFSAPNQSPYCPTLIGDVISGTTTTNRQFTTFRFQMNGGARGPLVLQVVIVQLPRTLPRLFVSRRFGGLETPPFFDRPADADAARFDKFFRVACDDPQLDDPQFAHQVLRPPVVQALIGDKKIDAFFIDGYDFGYVRGGEFDYAVFSQLLNHVDDLACLVVGLR